MNKYKKYYVSLITTFCLTASGHLLSLLIVDPLNILPFDITKNEFFIKEMRFQAAPIINKYDFNSAILGTSMAENFNAEEADKLLGGKFINLSLSGGLISERKIVLEHLLNKSNIHTVIISLDNITDIQRNQGIPLSSWSFLYNKRYLDDQVLYTNRKNRTNLTSQSSYENILIQKV